MVLVIAWWGASQLRSTVGKYWRGIRSSAFTAIGLITAIIAVEDLGTAVLIFAVACLSIYSRPAI